MKHMVTLSEAMAIVNSTTNASMMDGIESNDPVAIITLNLLKKLFDCNDEELFLSRPPRSGHNKIIVAVSG